MEENLLSRSVYSLHSQDFAKTASSTADLRQRTSSTFLHALDSLNSVVLVRSSCLHLAYCDTNFASVQLEHDCKYELFMQLIFEKWIFVFVRKRQRKRGECEFRVKMWTFDIQSKLPESSEFITEPFQFLCDKMLGPHFRAQMCHLMVYINYKLVNLINIT